MAETTTIAVIPTDQFPALLPDSDAREALLANLGAGERIAETDLVRVSIPAGGATHWTVRDVAGDSNEPEIQGVLVCAAGRRVLWPSEDPGSARPVCTSEDLIHGRPDLEAMPAGLAEQWRAGGGVCDHCPLNEFGSGKSGRGKRCKEVRLWFVLRAGDALPLVVQVSPGSLKSCMPFVKRLPVPHYRAVVGLRLESVKNAGGQAYSRIVPRLVGTLDRAAGELVRGTYTENLRRVAAALDVRQGSDSDD
jgi:hypothetical protein